MELLLSLQDSLIAIRFSSDDSLDNKTSKLLDPHVWFWCHSGLGLHALMISIRDNLHLIIPRCPKNYVVSIRSVETVNSKIGNLIVPKDIAVSLVKTTNGGGGPTTLAD